MATTSLFFAKNKLVVATVGFSTLQQIFFFIYWDWLDCCKKEILHTHTHIHTHTNTHTHTVSTEKVERWKGKKYSLHEATAVVHPPNLTPPNIPVHKPIQYVLEATDWWSIYHMKSWELSLFYSSTILFVNQFLSISLLNLNLNNLIHYYVSYFVHWKYEPDKWIMSQSLP